MDSTILFLTHSPIRVLAVPKVNPIVIPSPEEITERGVMVEHEGISVVFVNDRVALVELAKSSRPFVNVLMSDNYTVVE